MQIRQRPDSVDTRFIYWAYSAFATVGGLIALTWGPLWLGADSAERPAEVALIRTVFSLLIASGFFSVALAMVEDPSSRRRGLLWLAIGHAAIFLIVLVQAHGMGSEPAERAAHFAFAIAFIFFYLYGTAEGLEQKPLISLFGGRQSPVERLRSEYEQGIREAASQEERNRLARDLHDSIKQQIFIIQTAAATVQARFDEDPAGAKLALAQVRNSAREAVTEMEVMLDQLRAAPLENVGLVEALRKQCEALEFRTGARVKFRAGKLPSSESLAPGAHQAVLRVAQEALANVGRHARTRNVLVTLDSSNTQLELLVRDDGVGFDPNQGHRGMGFENMRARAQEFGGQFELESRPGGGTTVTFAVPYAVEKPAVVHLRQAASWGALLLVLIAYLIWKSRSGKNLSQFPSFAFGSAAVAAIAFTREVAAYIRARKRSEAAR